MSVPYPQFSLDGLFIPHLLVLDQDPVPVFPTTHLLPNSPFSGHDSLARASASHSVLENETAMSTTTYSAWYGALHHHTWNIYLPILCSHHGNAFSILP